jgi:hypothetical protein
MIGRTFFTKVLDCEKSITVCVCVEPRNRNYAHAQKNVLFSSSALLDQRFLQLINKALINCKERLTRKKNVCMIPELLNGYGNISPFLYLL